MIVVFSGKGIDEEGQKSGQEEGALHTVGMVCGTMKAV
jgi:hypothetical protein